MTTFRKLIFEFDLDDDGVFYDRPTDAYVLVDGKRHEYAEADKKMMRFVFDSEEPATKTPVFKVPDCCHE